MKEFPTRIIISVTTLDRNIFLYRPTSETTFIESRLHGLDGTKKLSGKILTEIMI